MFHMRTKPNNMGLSTSLYKTCALLFLVIVTAASEGKNRTLGDRTPDIIDCSPTLGDIESKWRQERHTVDIHLNSTNVACVLGYRCSAFFNRSLEQNVTTYVVLLDIQNGDEISLKLDIESKSENDSTQLTVTEITVGVATACDVTDEPILTANGMQNITLNEDLLLPGNRSFFVKYSTQDSDCELIWNLRVKIRNHECAKSKDSLLCSGRGTCDDPKNKGHFSCHCCPSFVGKYCEEKDGCFANPCAHGGFCVDIAEGLVGTTFQCLCPHGYRGRSCEGEVSLCDKRPCLNNGSCHGNQTQYGCLCPKGFSGHDCQNNINECLSNPCIHGVCEDGLGSYKCYCLPGYGGDHCEFEYDECDSSPCINGGACEDLVAGYRCHCGPGYRGRRCQIKVDLCQPNPCPSPAQCVDRGNNYSCVCHPGFNGPGCTQHYDPCYPNPCQNAGSCWPSLDSYFCSCRPGYTGDLCEESMYPSQPLPRTLEDPGEPEDRNSHRGLTGSSMPVDHWHNMYLAGSMLTLALTLVILVAVVCHCRIHKTYLTFTRKLSRSCSENKQQKPPRQVFFESSWERF